MSTNDLLFVKTIITGAIQHNHAISRDIVKDCYYADLKQNGTTEPIAISDKWIDYYFEQLCSIPFNQLEHASRSTTKFSHLLMQLFGK